MVTVSVGMRVSVGMSVAGMRPGLGRVGASRVRRGGVVMVAPVAAGKSRRD